MTINAKITDIRTQFSLQDGKVKSYVVLQLPDGVSIVSEVSSDAAQHLFKLSGHEVVEEPVAPPRREPPVPFEEPVVEEVEEAPPAPAASPSEALGVPVDWSQLPDEVLAPEFKAALRGLNAPRLMYGPQLHTAVNDIQARFSQEDWQRVLESPAEPEPEVGVVSWEEGAPRRPQVRPARTVPADAFGNPIVPGFVQAQTSSDDEDYGAPQL